MKTYFIYTGNHPETIDIEYFDSSFLPSLCGVDCVCIVSSLYNHDIVMKLESAVISDPGSVYGLTGTWLDINDTQNVSNAKLCVKYDRRPAKQRFEQLDRGSILVHFFNDVCYAFNPSVVDVSNALDPIVFSDYLEHSGIKRVVIDTNMWNGPRLGGPRYSRINLDAKLYEGLTGKYNKITNKEPQVIESINNVGVLPEKLEPSDYSFSDLPELMVIITTHNRTNTAIKTIESLVTHLKYPKLHWCVCDDRSDGGHVSMLMDKFAEMGVEDVKVCRTNDDHWGLGASMNNGLREAFKVGPVVLTTEDDWLLTRDLDVSDWVRTLVYDQKASYVRLAGLYMHDDKKLEKYTETLQRIRLLNYASRSWVFSNMVALRHRRFYDKAGLYLENCHSDTSEGEMLTRYLVATNWTKKDENICLFPTGWKTDTITEGFFSHIGESTVGHTHPIAKNNCEGLIGCSRVPFFRVITPTWNSGKFLDRCADSLLNQTFKDFVWIIADDCSTDDTREKIKSMAAKDDRIKFIFLDQHRDAGGARNAALSVCSSEYTLYLDSDDVVYDKDSMYEVYKTLATKNFPDVLRLHGSYSMGSAKQSAINVEELVNCSPAPWHFCHKTSMSVDFVPNRRKNNDVVWFYRLCDKINSVATCTTPWAKYMMDNALSAHNGKVGKADARAIAADYYLIGDLMSDKFKKQCVKNAVTSRINKMKGDLR